MLSIDFHLAGGRNLPFVLFILTMGQVGDNPQLIPVLTRIPLTRSGCGRPAESAPHCMLAAKG